jgi:hypothetical protein
MNPSLDAAIATMIRQALPLNTVQNSATTSSSVPREVVDACTVRRRVELLPVVGTVYRAFVDPSDGSADSMTLAIAHKQGEITVLDAVREIRSPFSQEVAVAEFAALLRSYKAHEVVGDRYAGEWPRERFRSAGIGYKISEQPKGDIYRDTLPLLNSGKVELLGVPRLASQQCGLERRNARGGCCSTTWATWRSLTAISSMEVASDSPSPSLMGSGLAGF